MKRILFLAPQPFFQERGTPIAVRMAVETLATSGEYSVDLLTYHEGFDVSIENVNHIRMKAPAWLYGIRPGISLKKLIADLFFFFTATRILLSQKYDVIHAVEESIYIALPFAKFQKTPVVYDMDSSLSDQLTESWGFLRPFAFVLRFFEGAAIRSSIGVLAVCDALKNIAIEHNAKNVECLYDVSLLPEQNEPTKEVLRETVKVSSETPLILYIGNLEAYQGMDLLLNSVALLKGKNPHFHLVILGGADRHIEKYSNIAKKLDLESRVSLLGPRPLSMLESYLNQATLLVSPRTRGTNTPMKVYSYLDSGIPLVATALPTHTQAINEGQAFLAESTPSAFAAALEEALLSPEKAKIKAAAAKQLVVEKYSFLHFVRLSYLFIKKFYPKRGLSGTISPYEQHCSSTERFFRQTIQDLRYDFRLWNECYCL